MDPGEVGKGNSLELIDQAGLAALMSSRSSERSCSKIRQRII